ncbi:MAG: PD-(D/E)XK nuclease family protein [Bacteroidetes bacterium]|nr:PD-(D/E)XK nuclease family protein [Bacteroidota bacterium]
MSASTDTPKLRMSSLSTFADCPRRGAFRQFAAIIAEVSEKFGRPIDTSRPFKGSRAARLGHALHRKIELLLNAKMESQVAPQELVEQATLETLYEGPPLRNPTDAPELAWDDLPEDDNIADVETALKMIDNMSSAIDKHVAKSKPLALERFISAPFAGFELTGHPDQIDEEIIVKDNKSHSGTNPKYYGEQFGGYGLILKEMGEKPTALEQNNFQRLKEKESPLRVMQYIVDDVIKDAENLIHRTANNLEAYVDSGDPSAFHANPHSPLCSPKWCDAYGTDWCTRHKQGVTTIV